MRECGLVQSSFDTVPLMVTGLLTSYSPATEWWASSGTAAQRIPAATIASLFLIASSRIAGWNRPTLLPLFLRERPWRREPRGVNRHVGLNLVERDGVLSVRPRDDD